MGKRKSIPAAVPMLDINGNVTKSFDRANWRARAVHAIERIAMGDSLLDLPIRPSELHAALRADEELRKAYDIACEVKAAVIAEKAMALADEPPATYETAFGERVDTGHVAWVKGRLDMARWYASVLDRRRFGPPSAAASEQAPTDARPTFVIESSAAVVEDQRTIDEK